MNTLALNAPVHDRVREHTAPHVNSRIEEATRQSIERLRHESLAALRARLEELEREWDVDRALMLNFALIGGSVFAAGALRNKKWFALLAAQFSFLAMHAVQGWCPPLPVFRRLGFRTKSEIEAERHALLALLRKDDRVYLA